MKLTAWKELKRNSLKHYISSIKETMIRRCKIRGKQVIEFGALVPWSGDGHGISNAQLRWGCWKRFQRNQARSNRIGRKKGWKITQSEGIAWESSLEQQLFLNKAHSDSWGHGKTSGVSVFCFFLHLSSWGGRGCLIPLGWYHFCINKHMLLTLERCRMKTVNIK